MQYTRLGDTGLIVSRLSLGAMTFGSSQGVFASVSKVDEKLAHEMTARTLDAGINHFNTADGYTGGQSEQILGRALGARRKDVIVSTKAGFRSGEALLHQGLSRQHILASVEGSLQRLGTDYIDLYLVHKLDPFTPVEETLEALNDVVRQGKVRYVGFSNWPAWRAAEAVGLQKEHDWARFRAAELYYSLLGRDVEHELAPFTQAAGIGIMVWSPLAGGFLTGKYTKENPVGDGGRLTGFDFLPYDRNFGQQVVERLRKIGQAHETTPAQVALAWVLAQRHVATILIGANKLTQLEDNLGAINLQLTSEELADLNQLTAPAPIYPNWFNERTVDPVASKALSGQKSAGARSH
jgi:aryl-alcohol dehydrogenase-like predicted oxidoreductase